MNRTRPSSSRALAQSLGACRSRGGRLNAGKVPAVHPRIEGRVRPPEAWLHRGPCGWFSDRSVCYLASGRPALAQRPASVATSPSTEDEMLAVLDVVDRD